MGLQLDYAEVLLLLLLLLLLFSFIFSPSPPFVLKSMFRTLTLKLSYLSLPLICSVFAS